MNEQPVVATMIDKKLATPARPVTGVSMALRWPRWLSGYRTEIAIALAIVSLELLAGMIIPAALSWGNFANVAQAAAPLIIMSLGVLLVVITGGIDLSVGAVFSLTGMVTGLAMAHGAGPVGSSLAGLSVGLVFGAFNGALVTLAGLAPFIVTLISYAIAGSLAFIVTDGHSMPIPDANYWQLNAGSLVPGILNHVLFCLLLLVLIEFGLKKVVLAKARGGNKVGMLSLLQDRENAQKYLKGAQESFKADGCELVQMLQTRGLTVNEAVAQANDLLTAHPDVKAIYGMYDEAATGAVKALQTRGLIGNVAVVTADGSPTTIKLLREGSVQGIFLQEAVGQGVDATEQVFNALKGKPTTKELALVMPLATSETINDPKIQQTVRRVYPPSAGAY